MRSIVKGAAGAWIVLASAVLAAAWAQNAQIGSPAPVRSATGATANSPPRPSTPISAGRMLVWLDPAHGGPDNGAAIAGEPEKAVTLELAAKLRPALVAAGFAVAATRDADPDQEITTTQRAESGDRSRAGACLVLHASPAGAVGVHLYTSALDPVDPLPAVEGEPPSFTPVPWKTAQAADVRQSRRLAEDLKGGLVAARVPVLRGRSSQPPLDNLTCPAVAVEVSVAVGASDNAASILDPAYQQQVVDALVAGLKVWKLHVADAARGTAP